MLFLWFIAWLLSGTPALHTSPSWNAWMIALVVSAALTVVGLTLRRRAATLP